MYKALLGKKREYIRDIYCYINISIDMYTLDLQSTQKQWQMTVYRDLLLKIDNPSSDCYWVGG